MGEGESVEWEDAWWVWGDDAAWARHQAQLQAQSNREHGRSLLKAEQWAALDQQGINDPALARQYDRFQPVPPRIHRGQ
jgi:hypothetical protein